MHFRDRLEVVARGRIASDGTGWQLDGERLLSLFADKYDGGPRTLDTRYQ